MGEAEVVVVGAGQAGLATGYFLRREGRAFVILEASDRPAGSWPRFYDSLTLFSPARHATLPGLPFPGSPSHYPTRDEVAGYLETYARHHRLPVETSTEVTGVRRQEDAFVVKTGDGRTFRSRALVAASGSFHSPHIPTLPGREGYQGRVLHSVTYRNPAGFEGRRVVVVGAGNSAVQIAVELARVARVTLAVRRPVRFIPQRPLGHDIHDWLAWSGAERVPLGWLGRLPTPRDVFDTGVYRRALRGGHPDQRPMFMRFTGSGVVWADGREEAVDAVLFATGFRPGLGYLRGLGALGPDGWPAQRGGVGTRVPGLYFVGVPGQRTVASSTLRGAGPDAAAVVGHLTRFLRRRPR